MTAVEKEQGCRSGGTRAKPPWLGQEHIPGGIEHGLVASGKDAMAEPPLAEVEPDLHDLRACRSVNQHPTGTPLLNGSKLLN